MEKEDRELIKLLNDSKKAIKTALKNSQDLYIRKFIILLHLSI